MELTIDKHKEAILTKNHPNSKSVDAFDDLLDRVDTLEIDHKSDLWPNITIDSTMTVVGQGTLRMKRVCKAIRINEQELNKLEKQYRQIPSDQIDQKDGFCNDCIEPVADMGEHLLSLLYMLIRIEFSDQLPDREVVVGIGREGKVFYTTRGLGKVYSVAHNRLYKRPA